MRRSPGRSTPRPARAPAAAAHGRRSAAARPARLPRPPRRRSRFQATAASPLRRRRRRPPRVRSGGRAHRVDRRSPRRRATGGRGRPPAPGQPRPASGCGAGNRTVAAVSQPGCPTRRNRSRSRNVPARVAQIGAGQGVLRSAVQPVGPAVQPVESFRRAHWCRVSAACRRRTSARSAFPESSSTNASMAWSKEAAVPGSARRLARGPPRRPHEIRRLRVRLLDDVGGR